MSRHQPGIAKVLVLLLMFGGTRCLASEATATYLGNEGVLVSESRTVIAFDPLFNKVYGQYELVPDELVTQLMNGDGPFENLSAVFVSHYHGDHFYAADMVRLLKMRSDIELYAPAQAVRAMHEVTDLTSIMDRITSIKLSEGDPPQTFVVGDLSIGVKLIPHAGWPNRMKDVQNLAWRVTLNDATTVLHLGDADTRVQHFAPDAEYWQSTPIMLALPPYWYQQTDTGMEVLERLNPGKVVGIHVPARVATPLLQRPPEFQGIDIFTRPGETRQIGANR